MNYKKAVNENPKTSSWTEEELLCNGEVYLASLLGGIETAGHTIDLESYIFEDDSFGRSIEKGLVEAVVRGVIVRVAVDGVGSSAWKSGIGERLFRHGVQIKVYHPIFGDRFWSSLLKPISSYFNFTKMINKRNHRKLCITDCSTAWLGSFNIWDVSLSSVHGVQAWREMGIKVQGKNVKFLCAAFDYMWYSKRLHNIKILIKLKRLLKKSLASGVRLNASFSLRRHAYNSLLKMLNESSTRIWICNPYFVPTNVFMNILGDAVKRGVEVRITTSEKSDVFFMPWVTAYFQNKLIKLGINIYSYTHNPLHAKFLIVDNSAVIGSSNINSRSLHHDLEVDVITDTDYVVERLSREFETDLNSSIKIDLAKLNKQSFWQKSVARIALLFKYYI